MANGTPPRLAQITALEGLTPATLAALGAIAERLSISAGALLFREGDRSDDLYVIESGRVVVVRRTPSGDEEPRVVELGPGEIVGELAVLDGEPRSASARAEVDTTLVRITPATLCRQPDGANRLADLKSCLGTSIVRRLRVTTGNYTAALERELERERERAATGRFIVTILTIFSVFTLLLEPIQELAEARFFDLGPVVALLTLVVIAFLITRWTGSSLRAYGVNFRPRRRDVWQAVLWSLGLCVLMTVAKFMHLHATSDATEPAQPLFAFFVLDDGTKVDTIGLYALGLSIYLVSVLFQEFATRCAIQAPLQRFLEGIVSSSGWVANITSTLLFAVLHAHLNPLVSLLVIVPSLLWGWLFMRSGSVVTPIISHVIIGVYAIFILGLFASLDHT